MSILNIRDRRPTVTSGGEPQTRGTVLDGRLPRVNLLGEREQARHRARRARMHVAAGAAVTVGIAAGLWILATGQIVVADHNYAVARDTATGLDARATQLQPVAHLSELLTTVGGQGTGATAQQIDAEKILRTVTDNMGRAGGHPVSITLTTAGRTASTAQSAASGQGGCSTTNDPFHPSTPTGCLQLAGDLPSRGNLATVVDWLNGSGVLAECTVASSTVEDGGKVRFALACATTPAALANQQPGVAK